MKIRAAPLSDCSRNSLISSWSTVSFSEKFDEKSKMAFRKDSKRIRIESGLIYFSSSLSSESLSTVRKSSSILYWIWCRAGDMFLSVSFWGFLGVLSFLIFCPFSGPVLIDSVFFLFKFSFLLWACFKSRFKSCIRPSSHVSWVPFSLRFCKVYPKFYYN